MLAASVKPFGRLIERIPTSIAAAMLAGVLIRFVMAVFESAQGAPGLVLPLVAVFLLVRLVQSGPGGPGRALRRAGARLRAAAWPAAAPLGSRPSRP